MQGIYFALFVTLAHFYLVILLPEVVIFIVDMMDCLLLVSNRSLKTLKFLL
jgi:hypothetical protein